MWLNLFGSHLSFLQIFFTKSNYSRDIFVVKHGHPPIYVALVGHVWREEIGCRIQAYLSFIQHESFSYCVVVDST